MDEGGSLKFPKKAPTLYFVGCTTAYRRPEIARATLKILKKAKVDFTVMNDEICCGSVFFRAGLTDFAIELAKSNLENIRKTGADTVITSCAGCYRMIKLDYPTLLGPINFKVLHTVELLSNLIKSGDIKFETKDKLKVSYHDPCHLGRHCGIYEEPRKTLEKIPNTEIVEMEWAKDKSYCCGAGAGLKALAEDLAVSIARKRLDDAVGRGAEVIVSACPFCKHNLLDSARKYNVKIEVKDIAEIVAERIA